MNYDVHWLPDAMAAFVVGWKGTANPGRLMDYYDGMNELLADDPHGRGESRGPTFRNWYHGPINVLYRIDERTKSVYVYEARVKDRPQ